jgi:hypothetical protein
MMAHPNTTPSGTDVLIRSWRVYCPQLGDAVTVVVEVKVVVAPVVELTISSPVPGRTWPVLFDELQHSRAALSCPQQKTPYPSHGVMTVSETPNSAALVSIRLQ